MENIQKRCCACGATKPIGEFVKDARKKDGHDTRCKTCYAAKSREWRQRPESRYGYLERDRKYREKKNGARQSRSLYPIPGYIYVFRWGNFYKIGRSKHPQARVRSINKSLPFQGQLIHLIKTNDMAQAEIKIHKKFSEKRQEGEWFLLSDTDVKHLQELDSLEYK